LDLKTRFGFPICIIFCNIIFGLDLNLKNLITLPVSSEISHFTSCAHANSNILHFKFAEKTDD